ncbi:hypothetical protein WMF31_39250 [Sorangium sp. So ce1036]|uniref:hypothetical protein n=1 Tax=Sorangium sp. So ce1036 TaxID=3133328 RepID=UPI003F06F75C
MNTKLRSCVTLLALLATAAMGAAACSDDDSGGTTSTSTSGTGGSGGNGGNDGGGGDGEGGSGEGGSGEGGSGEGGSGEGGSGEGGNGGGASACAGLYCDDFEAYTAAEAPGGKWTVYTAMDGSAVSVDTTMAYSGTKSVKVTTPQSSGDNNYKSAMIQFKDESALPVEGNVVHGRMMFFLESAPETDVHWTLVDGAGVVPNSDFEGMPYSAVYRYGGQHPVEGGSQLMANYDTPGYWSDPRTAPQTDCWHHAEGKVVPVGEWTCVEFSFDGPKNEMRFWLNGEEITELKMSGAGQGCANNVEDYEWTAPEFTSLGFGWESYQEDAPRTMWIDDVVIGTEPIGCPTQQ